MNIKHALSAFALIAAATLPSLSQAGFEGVEVGDKIKMYTGYPGHNGEFRVHHEDSGYDVEDFRTFCVESDEYLIKEKRLEVYGLGITTDHADPSNSRTLGNGTAWLFRQFSILGANVTWGFDATNTAVKYLGNNSDANALQAAIWWFTGKQPGGPKPTGNKFIDLVEDNWNSGAKIKDLTVTGSAADNTLNIAGVQIMNLRRDNWRQRKSQDQLYYNSGLDPKLDPKPVPEPMSAAIWGTILVGGMAVRRRRQRRQTSA